MNQIIIENLSKIIPWDGSYESLKKILIDNCMQGVTLIPFRLRLINGDKTLIFSKEVSHRDAPVGANFFLFNNKKELIKSSVKLSGLFQTCLT